MTHSDSNPPPGYQRHQLHKDAYRKGVELFVPTRVKDELLEEDNRDLLALAKEQAAELEAAVKEAQSRMPDIPPGTRTPSAPAAMAMTRDESDKDLVAWHLIDATDKTMHSRRNYPVFKSDQALALIKNFGSGDAEVKERLKKIYNELLLRGTALREIATLKSLKPLEVLAAKQPHMKEVVQFVMAQINLAQHSRKPVRLQPMLLLGEAGVGKTHFVQSLAQALSTTIHIQQMDADLTPSFLMGSDRTWGNSQHGMLFSKVVLGQHANPVIVLDELDKSQRSFSHGSPLSSLYSVLEPLSAKAVRDISLLFEFDASQVTWVATANHAELLDQPLRTRFREFHIVPPTASECLVLAEEVMRAAIESVGVKGFKPDVSMRRYLAHLPARQIWQLTREAMANAVTDKRNALCEADFPHWLFDDAAEPGKAPTYLH